MSKSILFIAVECYQCSTMQVKQQKKSSNKWNCAVCNEKQSVRKVYAQGYQAKDIRQFVQSFNMSRKFADDREYQEESSVGNFVEHLEGDRLVAEQTVKRRSDWSEYVDDDDEGSLEPSYLKSNLREGEMFDYKVVTELPEDSMFKKPKLKGNFSSSSVNAGESRSYKPQFSRRSGAHAQTVNAGELRFEVGDCEQKSKGMMGTMKTVASKWAEYLTTEDDETATACDEGCTVRTDDDCVDLLVEEDIHPDFM